MGGGVIPYFNPSCTYLTGVHSGEANHGLSLQGEKISWGDEFLISRDNVISR